MIVDAKKSRTMKATNFHNNQNHCSTGSYFKEKLNGESFTTTKCPHSNAVTVSISDLLEY